MHSKKKQQEQRKLNQFILQLTNLTTFSPLVYPWLQVDTTAVHNLRAIHRQTADEKSQQAEILHYKSQQLLSAFEEVDQHYYNFQQNNICSESQKVQPELCQPTTKAKPVKNNVNGSAKNRKDRPKYENHHNNDQNVNLSNFQHIKATQIKHKKLEAHKPININIQLKQIIRPEYRRQPHYKPRADHFENEDEQIQKNKANPPIHRNTDNCKYYQSSEDQEMVPPVCLRKKKSLSRSDASARSVSPKIERPRNTPKNNLNNISQISRNYQSGSDVSFEIDLNSMGIFPQNINKNIQLTDQRNFKQTNIRRKQRATSKPTTNYIQEQDEEEIQEEIRQIDERLSHRAYRTHRVKTQIQHEPHELHQNTVKESRVEKRDFNAFQNKNKEPKTVRLSLTPQKHKLNNQQNKKVEVRRVQIMNKNQGLRVQKRQKQASGIPKFQGDRTMRQNKQKYELVTQIQRQVDEEQAVFAKWKKPKRGIVQVDLRRYAQ